MTATAEGCVASWRAAFASAKVTGVATINRCSLVGLLLTISGGDADRAIRHAAEALCLLRQIQKEARATTPKETG